MHVSICLLIYCWYKLRLFYTKINCFKTNVDMVHINIFYSVNKDLEEVQQFRNENILLQLYYDYYCISLCWSVTYANLRLTKLMQAHVYTVEISSMSDRCSQTTLHKIHSMLKINHPLQTPQYINIVNIIRTGNEMFRKWKREPLYDNIHVFLLTSQTKRQTDDALWI